MDAFRMIEAPSGSSGSAFCTVKRRPFTLMSKIESKSSSVILPKGAYFAIPAFANTISSLPFSRLICAKRCSRSPRFDTSPCTPVTFLPISFTARANSGSRRPVMKTYAPSSTNCFAVARPMPLLPPVTSAIFSSSLPMHFLLGSHFSLLFAVTSGGLRSGSKPFIGHQPAARTTAAVTLLNLFERSKPPCAAMARASRSSICCPRDWAKKSLLPRDQHHAEPGFALHHASVSIRSLFEGECLDHRADILQDAEGKGVLAINRRAGQATVDRATSKDEREGIQLHRVPRYTHHDELPAGCKAGHKWPHSTATGGCCKNCSGPAHTLQHRCGIIHGSIDVDVRAQVFRKLFLLASLPDCDGTESHVPGKLDAKVPKATNALHSDQISAAQAGVAKSVVGGDTRAEERGGFCGTELIRNGRDAARFSDHHFRISSIRSHSRCHRVLTIHNVSASARFAHP